MLMVCRTSYQQLERSLFIHSVASSRGLSCTRRDALQLLSSTSAWTPREKLVVHLTLVEFDPYLISEQQQDGEDGVAETANLAAPADDISASDAEPSVVAELPEVPGIGTLTISTIYEVEIQPVKLDVGYSIDQQNLTRETSDIQSSELSASPVKGNGDLAAGLPTSRRVKSHPTLVPTEVQLCHSEDQGPQLNLEKLTSQLVSQHLEDTGLFPSSPLVVTSPNTPSRSTFGAQSRPDSGFGQSPTSEAQRWKRAYYVQQVTHRTVVRSLSLKSQDDTRAAEERLEEAKKTHATELSDKQEQLSTIVSMHQALYAQHEELKAQKAGSPASSAPKPTPKPASASDEAILLKSRLEQSDRELLQVKATNRALENNLNNTRYVNKVGAEEFAQLQTAWEYEVGRNNELSAQSDNKAVPEMAEYKSLYEKECMKNIQLRLAMEKDPSKTAEMDRTVDHLQKALIDCQASNNQQVTAFENLEKQSKHEKTLAEAQLKAAASQNEMLADTAHVFCKRKATFQSATNSLIADLPECNDQTEIARAVNRYCDTVTYEKQLENFIEKGAAQLTEAHGTIGRLEVRIHEQQTEIEDQHVNYEILDSRCKNHENKITELEVEANHRAGDLSQITTTKNRQIQQLQSQLAQIETQLRSGLDACIQWFLASKDQEIDTQKARLATVNQQIEQLEQNIHTKGVFQQLDDEHRAHYLIDLESYPPRLAAAEQELDSLRSRVSAFESQSPSTHENYVDLKTHTLRVSEVQSQTRVQLSDDIRAQVGSQIKNETEQRVLKQWIQPLQQLGSFLWARIARLELPHVERGVDVHDRERWVLGEQSRRLRVGGWEGAGNAVPVAGNAVPAIGGIVGQGGQVQVAQQVQGRRQGPWNP